MFSNGWFSIYFLLRDSQNDLLLHATHLWSLQCVAQPNISALTNIANPLPNIANAFKNNYNALESIANGLKYVVIHLHYIFSAFQQVFANRVTIILCRVMFLWYCSYCVLINVFFCCCFGDCFKEFEYKYKHIHCLTLSTHCWLPS